MCRVYDRRHRFLPGRFRRAAAVPQYARGHRLLWQILCCPRLTWRLYECFILCRLDKEDESLARLFELQQRCAHCRGLQADCFGHFCGCQTTKLFGNKLINIISFVGISICICYLFVMLVLRLLLNRCVNRAGPEIGSEVPQPRVRSMK